MDFEAVYGKYGDMLFRTAFMYTGDSHSAEDILQDVFIAYSRQKNILKVKSIAKPGLSA